MEFRLEITINKPLTEVFAFFRDIDQHAGREGTIVPLYDKLSPGPPAVGTRYRELVRLLPGLNGEILTEVTGYEEGRRLSYRFVAMGMEGRLTYQFEGIDGGTRLAQHQSLQPRGVLWLFSPLIRAMFSRMVERRLSGIKDYLEKGGREE